MATMSRQQFFERVDTMQPGECAVYHTGSLMHDRVEGSMFAAVHATACAAWDMMEAGKVKLVQRVLERQIMVGYRCVKPPVLEYRAIKCAPPFERVEWSGPYAKDRHSYVKPAKRVAVEKYYASIANARTMGHAVVGGQPTGSAGASQALNT